MEKIDFFGGLHGNFLELMINLFIYQIHLDSNYQWFNKNGACHVKNNLASYIPKIKCNHYSFFNMPFSQNDRVIEIHCDQDYMLLALVNSLTRAADQIIDIWQLEKNTIKKLAALPKANYLLEDIIKEHGERDEYPRSVIRNYFYSKFDSAELGLHQFNDFKHTGPTLKFPFSAFFDFEQLCMQLNNCAFFLDMNFYPTLDTVKLWNNFIQKNQGYQSHIRCHNAMVHILSGDSMYIGDFNLVEEAWLLHRIAKIFRYYNPPFLDANHMPTDTKIISQIVYDWKSKDFPSVN
jgi:hypothetical protein